MYVSNIKNQIYIQMQIKKLNSLNEAQFRNPDKNIN